MIAIFGANGFIGRHLTRTLGMRNFPVRAVVRRIEADFVASVPRDVSFYEADFRDPLMVIPALADIETVVDLIGTSSPALGNRHLVPDLLDNVIPHVELYQNCLEAGVKRVILASSGGTIYGPTATVPTPETASTQPISSHGLTKLILENYLNLFARTARLDATILRLGNPYGPGQQFKRGQGLIPAVLERHRMNLPIQIYGNGSAARDYVYIDDVVEAFVRAIEKQLRGFSVCNIGGGRAISVSSVISLIETAIGASVRKEFLEQRDADVSVNWLDISSSAELLGWCPSVRFEEGIVRTIRSFLSSNGLSP